MKGKRADGQRQGSRGEGALPGGGSSHAGLLGVTTQGLVRQRRLAVDRTAEEDSTDTAAANDATACIKRYSVRSLRDGLTIRGGGHTNIRRGPFSRTRSQDHFFSKKVDDLLSRRYF